MHARSVTWSDPTGKIAPVLIEAAVFVYRGVTAGMAVGNALVACWAAYQCVKCLERAYEGYKQFEKALDDDLEYAQWMRTSMPFSECSAICGLAAESFAKAVIWRYLMKLVGRSRK